MMENVTVEDQTSHLLSVPPLEDIPMCDHDPCIRDTLIEYAELGDVQVRQVKSVYIERLNAPQCICYHLL